MIEAHFPFNEEILSEAYDAHRSVRRWPKYLRLLAFGAIAWGLWLLLGEHRYVLGGIVLGGGLTPLLFARLNRLVWLRAISETAFYGSEVHCRFDTREMIMGANGKAIRLPWEDTYKIVDTDTGYLIYPKTGAFYYIPGRAFATDIDAERVRGVFLSEKMRRN